MIYILPELEAALRSAFDEERARWPVLTDDLDPGDKLPTEQLMEDAFKFLDMLLREALHMDPVVGVEVPRIDACRDGSIDIVWNIPNFPNVLMNYRADGIGYYGDTQHLPDTEETIEGTRKGKPSHYDFLWLPIWMIEHCNMTMDGQLAP